MSIRRPLLCTLFGLTVGTASARALDGRPVRNSFVNRPAPNVALLVAQVRSDATVADRYERHFSMTKSEIVRILSALHRAPLARSGIFTIYSVPVGGRLRMHVGLLRKGEPMFFDRSGRPVLVVRCGNPVTLGPRRHAANVNNPMPTGESDARELSPDGPRSRLADAISLALAPALPYASPALDTLGVTSTTALGEPTTSSPTGWSATWPTFAAGFFPLLAGLDSGSGGHGPARPAPQPVPEPTTIMAFGLGVATILRRRKKA
jgi:hypothetical protein